MNSDEFDNNLNNDSDIDENFDDLDDTDMAIPDDNNLDNLDNKNDDLIPP